MTDLSVPGCPSALGCSHRHFPTPPAAGTSYLWLEDVRFAQPGCWVTSLAVDGKVVGSAILPVSERIAAAD